ncbi:hypothetical protein N7493_011103 [Penicillium malachiteum]|uniref:Uncharacterized protein n=1 Tax=Penicillium malachiteum TaxID=1324776 RepID=A0AAD6HBI5_9EURO|nr:hypothetical protein N7493_011103 [Penicillium malachiteum]
MPTPIAPARYNPLSGITTMWDSWWTRPVDDGFENETAYTPGWYRTTLPTSALGLLGINRYADPKESNMKEIIGRDSTPSTLYGHNGNANGSTSAAYLFPESHS